MVHNNLEHRVYGLGYSTTYGLPDSGTQSRTRGGYSLTREVIVLL